MRINLRRSTVSKFKIFWTLLLVGAAFVAFLDYKLSTADRDASADPLVRDLIQQELIVRKLSVVVMWDGDEGWALSPVGLVGNLPRSVEEYEANPNGWGDYTQIAGFLKPGTKVLVTRALLSQDSFFGPTIEPFAEVLDGDLKGTEISLCLVVDSALTQPKVVPEEEYLSFIEPPEPPSHLSD